MVKRNDFTRFVTRKKPDDKTSKNSDFIRFLALWGEEKEVRPEGLEPPTLWSEARCSIQLS
jgi:hypothetical protein